MLIYLLAGPNNANGLDMDKYSWGQSLQEVNITVPVPPGTKSRFITCEIKKNHLKVGVKGQPPVIDVSVTCSAVFLHCCHTTISTQLWLMYLQNCQALFAVQVIMLFV